MPSLSRFVGRIAGVGTTSGVRLVFGLWNESPFGSFADVMIEEAGGRRILLAPTDEIARYVSLVYTFDEVRVVDISWRRTTSGLTISAGRLDARLGVGGISTLGRLLRIVPRTLSTKTWWLAAIDPAARVLLPGTRTAGSAGGGLREYYGVTRARSIRDVSITWQDRDLGDLAPLYPPVRFGFGSAPATPQIVDVTTTIR